MVYNGIAHPGVQGHSAHWFHQCALGEACMVDCPVTGARNTNQSERLCTRRSANPSPSSSLLFPNLELSDTQSLWALTTSPPLNRCTFLWSSCSQIENTPHLSQVSRHRGIRILCTLVQFRGWPMHFFWGGGHPLPANPVLNPREITFLGETLNIKRILGWIQVNANFWDLGGGGGGITFLG